MSCPLCDDTGWKPVDEKGIRSAVGCDCWRQKTIGQALIDVGIPPRYERCEFSTFVTYANDRLLNAVAAAKRFADTFPVVDKGLMIIGPPGIGKTHLAISALKQAVRTTGAHARYYDTRGLLTKIRGTYNSTTKTAEMDVIRPVMEAHLLILDDLGAER